MKNDVDPQQAVLEPTDKRDVAEVFRDRMALLIAQKGFNLSRFSQQIGIDRVGAQPVSGAGIDPIAARRDVVLDCPDLRRVA